MKLALIIATFQLLGFTFLPAQEADLSYYDQIVHSSRKDLSSSKLRQLELDAYSHPTSAEVYYPLARAFATTSERVWAIVYGEIYCNLTSEPNKFLEMSALLGKAYQVSLIYENENESTIYFTDVSEESSQEGDVPFEISFELSIATGYNESVRFRNLSIATIHDIRLAQLRVWSEKKLASNALINWLGRLKNADIIEAYDYWLFQGFRPAEFAKWKSDNPMKLDEFLEWRKSNQLDLSKGEFSRIH